MEQSEDLRRERTALGVMCFIVTETILTFVEILCVGAYFGTILSLLYFTFLKDCLEILTYATVKCISRLKWLYKILRINELLYLANETDGLQSNTSRNLRDSVSVISNSYLVENSTNTVTTCSRNSKTIHHGFSTSQSRNSLQFEFEDENRSSAVFQSPQTNNSVLETPTSRKLSSISTQIISSTENYNIDETNFEDVDLSEDGNETITAVPKDEPISEQSPSKWNISKMKIFDAFRRNRLSSPASVKTKLENMTSKVTDLLPQKADDNDKLIGNKNDSPEQIGCCTSLPHIFKAKYPLSSMTSYARF